MTRPIRAGYEKLAAFLGRDMNLIHALALVGLILRLFVALKSEQIYHADELFQYLEQAHRLVFGYGHITWEFRWGARSWILPGFISSILFFCKALNLDTPTVYIPVVKVFFSVISISLIYSVYFATRRIATPQAATLASLFACFWYELIYFAARATPEVLAAYLIVGALALVLADTDARRPLLFGLLCALAVALRLQYAIPVLALIAYAAYKWRAADLQRAALSFLLVAVAAGYLDRLTWGKMFASYVNSFVFNVQYNISSLVFGISDPSFYPLALAIASSGLLLAGALAAIWKWRNTWLVLALVISTIAAHSLIPHKEYRFVFVVIPLLLILLATALSPDFLATLSHRLRQGWRTSSILAFIGISMAGAANALPFERFVYANPVTARSEALDAALVLSQENDVQAVINIASNWYEAGGYYYLHKHLPIYSRDFFEKGFIDINKAASFASHVICPIDFPELRGFAMIRRLKTIEIRTRVDPSAPLEKLKFDTMNILQEGIDNRRWEK